jgi:ribulose-5-phosphate 4-epimerase/fuculose-1-phosphate aldolase
MTDDRTQREALVAAARTCAAYGLVKCSSGNLSQRVDDGQMLISASRSWMAELTAEQVVRLRIEDGEVLAGPRPSVETRFHRGILQRRSELNVVLHFQSPFATTLACTDARQVNWHVLPEVPFYIGEVAVVPYLPPGSAELADAVVEALADHDLAVLTNHGLVVAGAEMDKTIQKAVFFELACEVIVRGGPAVVPLSPEAVEALKQAAGGATYGQ